VNQPEETLKEALQRGHGNRKRSTPPGRGPAGWPLLCRGRPGGMITGTNAGSLPTGGSDGVESVDQEEITMIDRVCMFCGKVYGNKPGHGIAGESHGVCPACLPNALVLREQGLGGVSGPLSARGRAVACA
jgi:hypothetical protein